MSFPVLLFLALLGTAFLGFMSAWFLQNEKMKVVNETNDQALSELSELKKQFSKVSRESELNALTVENLQHLLLDYEQKVFDLQRKLIEPKPASNGHAIGSTKSNLSLPNVPGSPAEPNPDQPKEPIVRKMLVEKLNEGPIAPEDDLIQAFKRGIAKEKANMDV